MEIKLKAESRKPLYLQLRDEIKELVLSGEMAGGSKLPSSRELARILHVSRNTVEEAYRYLVDDGLLQVQRGKGTFVSQSLVFEEREEREGRIQWEKILTPAVQRYTQYRESIGRIQHGDRKVISFTSLAPDHHLFSVEAFRKCMNDVLSREGGVLLNYGYTRGYEPLRNFVGSYLKSKGIRGEEQELLIVNGFRQGMELVTKALVQEGDRVLCEAPTYNGAIGIFQSYGAEIVGIDMDDEGIRLDLLEKAIQEKRPAFIYTIPTYQNPTGMNMSLNRRRDLLELADRYGIPIVEDGFNEELRYRGEAFPSLKAMDKKDLVIYIGSFSKILFPGLRIGWVMAPEAFMKYLVNSKYNEDIHTGILHQAGLYEFCSRGYFERHLRYSRRIYRVRLDAMLEALRIYMTGKAKWMEGTGGFSLWLEFPSHVRTREWLQEAQERGILFVPGDVFYADGRGENFIRLGFSRVEPKQIKKGIRILSEIVGARLGR